MWRMTWQATSARPCLGGDGGVRGDGGHGGGGGGVAEVDQLLCV